LRFFSRALALLAVLIVLPVVLEELSLADVEKIWRFHRLFGRSQHRV